MYWNIYAKYIFISFPPKDKRFLQTFSFFICIFSHLFQLIFCDFFFFLFDYIRDVLRIILSHFVDIYYVPKMILPNLSGSVRNLLLIPGREGLSIVKWFMTTTHKNHWKCMIFYTRYSRKYSIEIHFCFASQNHSKHRLTVINSQNW